MFTRDRLSQHYKVILILIILISTFLIPIPAHASSNPSIVMSQINRNSSDKSKIEDLVREINNDVFLRLDIEDIMSTSSSGADLTVTFDMSKYENLKQQDKQKLMKIVLTDIQDSNVSNTNKMKIYNFVSDSDEAVSSLVRQLNEDVTADIATAYGKWYKPAEGWLGVLLGIASLGIFVCLAVTMALDIAYIVIPAFQLLISSFSENKKVPKIISKEAISAVKEAESNVGHMRRSPLGVYFKMRVKAVIALAICLVYLLGGQIYTLVAYILDLFQGFLPS